MAWIGRMGELEHYLAVVRADKDEEGKFLVRGNIVTFMGMTGENAEVVVDDEAVYFSRGHECKLAAGLGTTSYGLKGIKVF